MQSEVEKGLIRSFNLYIYKEKTQLFIKAIHTQQKRKIGGQCGSLQLYVQRPSDSNVQKQNINSIKSIFDE